MYRDCLNVLKNILELCNWFSFMLRVQITCLCIVMLC